ncbi:MAG: histidinol-phosphate transaminase [Elusimicrobia bacterium RIFOXYD2_FULL_34_15]|nr:MAG: histidinol-phosphate transaminase [Elusimicrobia bacterium RIFOXYD2_FULL_34_15]
MKDLVRKNVLNFQSYIPGKPIEDVKREFKLKEVIKLASNENPLGPSKKAVSAIKKVLNNINIYPDGNCFKLRKKIAKIYDVLDNQIIFGNGTDEIIELVGKTFLNPEDEIVASKHAFIRYKMAGDLMGCKVIEVPMKNYKHDLEAMANVVTKNTKVVFIANPNNPTGTYNNADEFEKYFSIIASKNPQVITFIDEAYAEYADKKDYPLGIGYLKKGMNVIFSRTFSKIYGLAGLRIGYGIGTTEVISFIERIRPPFNVSSVAQEGAGAALEDKQHINKSRAMVITQKRYLYKELQKIGLEYIPSIANFILINVKKDGKIVFQELLSRGIIVRAMDEYGFKNFIRVTIGTIKQNIKFIREIKGVL